MNKISVNEPQTEPGIASAEGGVVILDGPGIVAVTMSPDAAKQTGESLLSAAELASAQASGQPDEIAPGNHM